MNTHDYSRRRRPRSDSMIAAAVVVVVTLLSACTTTPGPTVVETIQGKWSLVGTFVTEVGADGVKCDQDGKGLKGSFEIVGSDARGKGVAGGAIYDLSGTISDTGAVEFGFAVSKRTVVRVFGNFSEDGGSGEWESANKCRGTWTSVKS